MIRACALLVTLLVGCDGGPEPPAAPRTAAALHDWLLDGEYRQWPDAGVVFVNDTGVAARIFVGPALADSLTDEAVVHPLGAAAVREIYEPDRVTLRGWAAAVKVAATREPVAGAWLWFEVFGTDAADPPQVAKRGAPTCVACHAEEGVDFVHPGALDHR